MTQLHFETTINCRPAVVFDLIADLKGYARWLNSSQLFEGLMEITENPVKLGTEYVDKGTGTTMRGRVIAYEMPARITFQQKKPIKIVLALGELTVTVQYTLLPAGEATHVARDTTVEGSGLLKLIEPLLIKQISPENERILQVMKATLEKPG
jgi:uncharacterized protein YndB with AHSA1/START domain